ncbi:MAG: HNH endonuclease [Bryobacterales bacterium]|nr:HNH endonuclease [Bryobacterales bacterium]
MDSSIRETVRQRAQQRCEYCLLPEEWSEFRHHVEHILARQHGGGDELENLALACQRCNLHKGTNIASIDPRTGAMVSLFNPRRDRWTDHFRLVASRIAGTSAVGRATTQLLDMNDTRRVELRAELIGAGRFPRP